MATYRTFIRSARNWQEFSSARKITVDRSLTYEQALRRCQEYNANRDTRQIRRGTKLEFTQER